MSLFKKNRRDLNLIPEEQQTVKTKKLKLVVVVCVVAVLVLEVFAYAGVFALHLNETSREKDITDQIAAKNAEWQKIASSAASAKSTKAKISLLKNFGSAYGGVELGISKIEQFIPSGIVVDTMTVTNEGIVSLSATTNDPAKIYQFMNVLVGESEHFSSPKLESVNKTSATSFVFKISVTAKADATTE